MTVLTCAGEPNKQDPDKDGDLFSKMPPLDPGVHSVTVEWDACNVI